MTIKNTLIKKGYFPSELGFYFSSKSLEKNLKNILNEIELETNSKSKCLKFSIPKGKHNRRILSIPNPYNYIMLCETIDKNWDDIKNHLKKSNLSLVSSNILNNNKYEFSNKYSFEDISKKFITESVGANYVVKIDISRYYSTIYTHSIPWALHTKIISKKNHSDNLFGNLLDKLVRNCQDRQTIGIPIGPDSSLIISETICVTIDEIIQKNNALINGIRYIDDWYIFCSTIAEAENILNTVQKALDDYELEINIEKTKISELPQQLEPNWVSRISNTVLTNDNITGFISLVNTLGREYPREEVFRYALSRLKKLKNVIGKLYKLSLLIQWFIIQVLCLLDVLYYANIIIKDLELIVK